MRVFVIVALVLMLVPIVAQADTLYYIGETTDSTTWTSTENPNWDGIGSATLWDYVYQISPLGGSTAQWGIVCPVPVSDANIHNSPGWVGHWYASIPSSEGTQVDQLWNQPGIVWQRTTGYTTPTFHFQTELPYSPTMQLYDGDSWPDGLTQYSANPEPGSLVLLGLIMAGGNLWRRRRRGTRS